MVASRETPALTYLIKLVEQFPDAPALTLAKRAYREHPELWASLDSCRCAVRRILGSIGDEHRKDAAEKRFFRKPRPAGWTGVIPESIIQLNDWKGIEVPGPHRTLILSDIHIPFHDMQALEAALKYGEQRKPTLILLNGDISDHYALSRWETDPRERDFLGEINAVKFFLAGLRKRFPKARVLYKLGNHEERLSKYLMLKAPELLGVAQFEFENIFGLDDYKVELIDQKRPIRLGSLNVIHGHEYTFAISNPVNPARGFFLRGKVNVLGGHLHQTSQHSEKNLEQKVVSAWSTGCLADLHPRYRPLNSWNHGFAFVETDRAGAFHVDNLRILDGKIY